MTDYGAFAETNDQAHLLGPPPTGKMTQGKDGKIWIEPEKYEPIIDMYIQIVEDSEVYHLESPLQYLDPGEVETL